MTTRAADPTLRQTADALLPSLIEVRRRLHRGPEVGLALPETQALIANELGTLGLAPRLGRGLSSVTAEIQGSAPGSGDPDRTIVLRADMDGLPLDEATGLPFSSEHPGAMHACGHDLHMTMLLGAARLLAERRDRFAGRVLLMFQPGEEGQFGARLMLEEGLLDGLADRAKAAAFGIHVFNRFDFGTVHLRAGAQLAAVDTLYFTVRGRGGHASAPHLGLDPITVAAELVVALQLMVTRTVDVADPVVVSIGRIAGGTTNNVIPSTVELEGTLRSLSEPTRAAMKERLARVAAGVGAAHGATIDLRIEDGYPVTMNDPAMTGLVMDVAREIAGPDATVEMPAAHMVGEDFAYLAERIPGAMAFLGVRPPGLDAATTPDNHSNTVVFDERPMAIGAALHAAVALRHLAGA